MKRNYFATILFCFCLLISNAKAAVPSDISLQLHVANPDGTPITGNIALTVRLFDGQLSNNALYENDIADRYVSVTEGFVNYYIKNVYGLDFSKEIWAEIAIDGNVMPERIRFSAVPHSFFANRAHTADSVDTANVARAVLDNSITSEKITNATITNADIAQNTITQGNINTASAFDWTAQHSFKSNNNEITLNSTNYALQITKGTAKLLRLEGNNIVASYILTDTFEAKVFKTAAVNTDTLRIGNYIVYKTGDALTIKDAATGSNGITLNGQALGYLTSPTFATDDKNAIINKEYVDSTQNNILATIAELSGTLNNSLTPLSQQIDTVKSDLANLDSDVAGLTNGLSTNRLAKWNGNSFINSNITEQDNLAVYSNTGVAFATKDSLALINKRYVDYTVDSAIKHVNGGMFEGLSHNTLPMWNATSNIFVNSKISEGTDTVRIGGARFTMEGSPQTTSIRDVNHLYSNSLWTNNIVAKGIATDVAEYTAIDPITKLPGSADSTTLVPVAYVTKVADSLVNRIEADSVDGARLKYATVSDSKIIDLSGNKIKLGTVAGGYNGQLANNTIIDDNLRTGSVRDSHIVSGAVYSRHIANGSIEAEDIKDGTVDANKIATGSVDSTHLKNAGISTADLANGAVTNSKLALNAVADSNVQLNSISGNKLYDNSITRNKIQPGEILGNYHLADSTITESKLSVTNLKYNNVAGTGSTYMPATGTTQATLATKGYVDYWLEQTDMTAIPGGRIEDETITSEKIKDKEVKTVDIADNAVNESKLSVTNLKYNNVAGSIDSYMPDDATAATLATKGYIDKHLEFMEATAIPGGRIEDGTITSEKIKDKEVKTADIAEGAVTDLKIAEDAVRDNHLHVNNIQYANTTSDYMPATGTTPATLTTKGYVDSVVSEVNGGGTSIGAGAVTTTEILDGTIDSVDIANGVITSAKIKNGAITLAKIANNSISTSKIAAGQVTLDKMASNSISTEKIVDGTIEDEDIKSATITGTKIANETIAGGNIADNAITSDKIASNAVVEAKIADEAVTNAKLKINDVKYSGNTSITKMPDVRTDSTLTTKKYVDSVVATAGGGGGNLTANSVETGHIKNGTILAEDIADSVVTNAKISGLTHLKYTNSMGTDMTYMPADYDYNSLITYGMLEWLVTDALSEGNFWMADDAVNTDHIKDGTIKNEDIAANAAIAGSKIANNTITADKLSVGDIRYNNAAGTNSDYMPSTSADATLTTKKYVDDKVANASGGTIAAGAITTTEIANGTIKDEDIASDAAIAGSKIADATITSTQIAATTIAEGNIAANAITSGKIADGTITSSDIGTGAVAETNIATDAITTAKIKDAAVTDAKLKVSSIAYEDNSRGDGMPDVPTNSTLTTKKYVDDSVAAVKMIATSAQSVATGLGTQVGTITATLNTLVTPVGSGSPQNNITIHGGRLVNSSVPAGKLANNAVVEANIADEAVTDDKLKVTNIEYNNAAGTNGDYMPAWTSDATLTTLGYVDYMLGELLSVSVSIPHAITTDGESGYNALAALSVENEQGGSAIEVKEGATKLLQTTIASDQDSKPTLVVSNTTDYGTALELSAEDDGVALNITNGSTSIVIDGAIVALTVDNDNASGIASYSTVGNVAMSYYEAASSTNGTTITLPGKYVINNIYGTSSATIVNLPDPVISGQIVYVLNNTAGQCIVKVNNSPVLTIAKDAKGMFIAATNASGSLAWMPLQ